jgi:RsiW-degrading membrane proteinase PrsW (M82 family)
MRPTHGTPARPGSGWRAPVPAPQGGRPAHSLLLRPALWLVVVLVGAGAWRVGGVLRLSFMVFPIASATAIVVFTLYAVPFLLLLRLIDYLARAPVALQAVALAWGGLVATSAAIAGGSAVQNILAKTVSPGYAAQWGPAVAGAGIEEILKALGVVAISLLARSRINSLVDGFVYGALVGLGFQVVENVIFALNAVSLQGEDSVLPVVVTFLLRGFMAGIWSHTLFTALTGAGVAYLLVRRDRPAWLRCLVAAALFGVAWGAHFLWNSPVLEDGLGYGLAGVFAALVVKAIPALVVGISLIAAAERRQADYYAALLAGLGDPRIASLDEIAALVSPRRRVAQRRRARLRLGRAGASAVRRLQSAQAKLAVALARDPSREPGPDVLKRRREVLVRRHELLAMWLVAGGTPRRSAAAMTSALILVYALLAAAFIGAVAMAIHTLAGA